MLCRAPGCTKSPSRSSPYCTSHEHSAFTQATPGVSAAYNDEPQAAVDPRHCEHTKEDGSRCKGWTVKGESLCSGHLGRGIAANPSASARLANQSRREVGEERRERLERAPRTVREARQMVYEELKDDMLDAWREAIRTGDPVAIRRAEASERLASRVEGRPTEHVVTEALKPRWKQEMDALSLEELEALRDEWRAERRKAAEAVKAEEEGRPPRPPLGASKEEVFAWRAEDAQFEQKRLQAVEDEPEEEAV
jgi:hypothetical protein